jgi:predicted GNAT family N-acyltransferase
LAGVWRAVLSTLFFFWENRQVEIKLAVSPAERLAVYQFRYSVIVEEMGVMIPAANHAEKLIREADDSKGHIFSATIDGKLAGTARINFIRDGDVFPHSDLLQLSRLPASEAVSVCSRFLVTKEHRGSMLAIRIVQAVYRFMRQSGIAFNFILVKDDLVNFYERIGYQRCGAAMTHPEIGDVMPLRLDTLDEDYLRTVRSPLVQCLRSIPPKENLGAQCEAFR